jgi:hypothetical protein
MDTEIPSVIFWPRFEQQDFANLGQPSSHDAPSGASANDNVIKRFQLLTRSAALTPAQSFYVHHLPSYLSLLSIDDLRAYRGV